MAYTVRLFLAHFQHCLTDVRYWPCKRNKKSTMRKLMYQFFVWLTLSANAALGQDVCNDLHRLSRINESIIQHYATIDQATTNATIDTIIVQSLRLSPSLLGNMSADISQSLKREALRSYLRVLANVRSLSFSSDLKTAERLLKSPQTIILAYKIKEILFEFDCLPSPAQDIARPTSQSNTAELGTTIDAKPLSISANTDAPNKFKNAVVKVSGAALTIIQNSLRQDGTIAAGALFAVSILGLLYRWKQKQNRRLKRRPLYYVVRWRKQGSFDQGEEGVILDINSFGAKLSISPPPQEGELGEVLLSGQWHKARVQWSKYGASGLKLDERIRLGGVFKILKESRDPTFRSDQPT